MKEESLVFVLSEEKKMERERRKGWEDFIAQLKRKRGIKKPYLGSITISNIKDTLRNVNCILGGHTSEIWGFFVGFF